MRFFLPICVLLCCHLTSAISPDGLTLLAFKAAVSGDPSATLADWNEEDQDPCRWPGVSCANVSGFSYLRVVALTVTGKNLIGYIPSELGSLLFLRRLNLHGNRLSGPIPAQISNASNLRSVFLYSNNLSGPVPSSLFSLPLLQNLDLSENALSGAIPNELRRCRQLQRLHLSGNRLSGEIPAGIWLNLENLLELDLSANNLLGPLPPDLGSLRSLSGTLNLSYNQFSGGIPSSLGNLSPAVKLDLRFNNLSGEIPATGNLTVQSAISFSGNPNLCGILIHIPCEPIHNPSPQTAEIAVKTPNKKKNLPAGMIILIAAAISTLLAIFILLALLYFFSKKNKTEKKNQSDESSAPSAATLVPLEEGFTCEVEDLLQASAQVLGKGRMGILYKVVPRNGIPLAVRRLSDGGEDRRRFAAEIAAVAKVRHPNVVSLKAYYCSPSEKLLVSEFISNGSLAANPIPRLPLSEKLAIAKGIARGLASIHESGPRKLVHGGIKPSNVLLDGNLKPYISDLGLTGIVGGGGGNSRYTAPEAVAGGKAAQSWDVYSFGILLLEVLTGREADVDLISAAAAGEGRLLRDMSDSSSRGEGPRNRERVEAALKIAMACVEVDPRKRPRMKAISEKLEKLSM